METLSPQFAGRALVNSTACTSQKPAVESTASLFRLEDPDQQNEDQNDQENGANSDVHAPPSFRGRLLFSGAFHPQTPSAVRKEGRKEAVSPRFFLRVAFAALVLAALLGALAQLAAGRRPVLLGGQTV